MREDFPSGETLKHLSARINAARDAPLSWRTAICGPEMFSWTRDFMSYHQQEREGEKKGGKRSTYGPVINTTDETLLFAFVSAPALLPNTRQPF